jgi:hypothetical protein
MLSLDDSAKTWDTACDALLAGHELGEAEYPVKKLDSLETDAE